MANTGAHINPEAVREIVYSSVSTNYAKLGNPLTKYARYFTGDNGIDVDIYLSIDGVTDMWRLRPGVAKVFDLKTNDSYLAPGDQFWIRSISATSSGDAFVELGSC